MKIFRARLKTTLFFVLFTQVASAVECYPNLFSAVRGILLAQKTEEIRAVELKMAQAIRDDLRGQIQEFTLKKMRPQKNVTLTLSEDGQRIVIDPKSFRASSIVWRPEKFLSELDPYIKVVSSAHAQKRITPTESAGKYIDLWKKVEQEGPTADVTDSVRAAMVRMRDNLQVHLDPKGIQTASMVQDVYDHKNFPRESAKALLDDLGRLLEEKKMVSFKEFNQISERFAETQIDLKKFGADILESRAGIPSQEIKFFPGPVRSDPAAHHFKMNFIATEKFSVRDLNDLSPYPVGVIELVPRDGQKQAFDDLSTTDSADYFAHDLVHTFESSLGLSDENKQVALSLFLAKGSKAVPGISLAPDLSRRLSIVQKERMYSLFREATSEQKDFNVAQGMELIWFEYFHEDNGRFQQKEMQDYLSSQIKNNFAGITSKIKNPNIWGNDSNYNKIKVNHLQRAAFVISEVLKKWHPD